MMKHEFDELVGITTAPEAYTKIEFVYMNSERFQTKQQIAEFYKDYDMNGIEKEYNTILEKIHNDKDEPKQNEVSDKITIGKMTLGRVVGKIHGNQYIMIRDYLSGVHYAEDTAEQVIDKKLDYNMELRNSDVYGISIEGNNIIVIDVLIDSE